ncbi:amino acid adenylation domain-containing protein [Burkholderia cenocepacia]|uniref:non-ribosomal peptide synthetase n=1 Tax=Burkholderia cenocepacia TaxID=95486 RepID=UPI000F57D7EB|nr:non-ribosomal peptide synthetase [Burkholderia cenocepacia]RQU33436.1 amino acid adenylation domain-containing protein [Burkholderia cenocepacia]RQU58587.1 amino acid adenylation domain-containing protein [Burkholderia cenocepacia]
MTRSTGTTHTAHTHAVIVEAIAAELAKLLDIPTPERERTLLELGGHSLHAMALRARLEQRFGVTLRVADLMQRGSPVELAKCVFEATTADSNAPASAPVDQSNDVGFTASEAQRAIYLATLRAPNPTLYNTPIAVELARRVEVVSLARALRALSARHDALRLRFYLQDDLLIQNVGPVGPVPFVVHTLSAEDLSGAMQRFAAPFELGTGPLWRAALFDDGSEHPTLLMDFHHLILDGASVPTLLRELQALLEAKVLPPPRNYRVAIEADARQRGTLIWREAEKYWRERGAGGWPGPSFPAWASRTMASEEMPGDSILHVPVPAPLVRSIHHLSIGHGTTFHCVFLAVLHILLAKLTRDPEFTVGVPVSGRANSDTEGVIGLFVRTLPSKHCADAQRTFDDLLHEIHTEHLKRLEYQCFPLSELPPSTAAPNFEVVLTTQRFDVEYEGLGRWRRFHYAHAHFPLVFELTEADGDFELTIEYDRRRFDSATVGDITESYLHLCQQVCDAPSTTIRALSMMDDERALALAKRFNPKPADCLISGTVPLRFTEIARQYAAGIALRDAGRTLSYAALDALTDRVASALRAHGLTHGDRVALISERRLDYVVAQLAILKCGAAYVPLDPDYPAARLSMMASHSGCHFALDLEDAAPAWPIKTLSWETLLAQAKSATSDQMSMVATISGEHTIKPDDIAYVMFTSGSTGLPKAVGVTHRNVLRLVEKGNVVPLHEDTRILLTGSPSFDATTFEVWGPLLHGGSVALVDKTTLLDAPLLRAAIEHFNITAIFLTSSLFSRLVHQVPRLLSGIEYLMVGGDIVPTESVQTVQCATPEVTLVSCYGPTENTTYSTVHAIPRGVTGPIPIGRPIARSTAYVFDDGGHLLPPLALGELYVGGEGVALGYLNDDATTAAKFIEYRWPDGRQERLYRTGDLARWDRDGVIHFEGRVDTQIKVRGYRVEPGEIRDALCACDGVRDAYIAYVRDGAIDGLAAWLVPDVSGLDSAAVLGALRSRLPGHMIPTLVAEVDELPLSVNGKIAREQLNAPLRAWTTASSLPTLSSSLTPSQLAIASLWCQILGRDSVDVDDSFFALGGDSFKVQTLAIHLAELVGERPTMLALFTHATVRAQATAFASQLDELATPTVQISTSGVVPEERTRFLANEAQTRLFTLDRATEGRAPYLIPVLLKLDGSIDVGRLRDAWAAVCHHHAFFRSRFSFSKGETWVDIAPTGGPALRVVPLGCLALEDALRAELRPCAIADNEVARATLFQATQNCQWLALLFHHIAFDGTAVEIILADLARAYRSEPLRAPTLTVFDLWKSRGQMLASGNATRRWWIDHLADAPREVQIPTDHVRNGQSSFEGNTITLPLSATLRERVRRVATETASTPYMVYLATLLVLLHRWSRQTAMTIGIVSNGRSQPGSEDIAGMLVNTLPVHFLVDDASAFRTLVDHVRGRVADAIDHQDVSLTALLADLPNARDGQRNPLFNVMFSMVTLEPLPVLDRDVSWDRTDWTYPTAKFDLTFFVQEDGNASRLALEYATDLFVHDSAQRLLNHFANLLQAIMADVPLLELSQDSDAERLEVLNAFNDTSAPYDRSQLIHRLFEESVDRHPEEIAVTQGETSLRYGELDERANRLAHLLTQKGVGPGIPVLIMMDRRPEVVVALLGVLKSGGYYVPVEPEYPTERVQAIASQLRVEFLLTNASALAQHPVLWAEGSSLMKVVCIDCECPDPTIDHAASWFGPSEIATHPANRLASMAQSEDTAYVIFTSGSTGEPKGVVVKHRPVINLIEWVNRRYRVGSGDRLLFVTSLCFDLSVYDIFGSLAAGATIYMATREDVRDPRRLLQILQRNRITFWDSAPAVLQQVLRVTGDETASSDLRLVFLSGDWIPVFLPAQLAIQFPASQLVALGGATEATVWSNYFEVHGDTSHFVSIPYGRPIQNARYYVLDTRGRPCPIGLPGRLFIGGECLASGYADRPDLTARRFLRDPFVESPDAVMYDTGDIARWCSSGQMQFLGREDQQVKIRGYRVELGEITYWLQRHSAVREAIVLPQRDASGALTLVAHLTLNDTITSEALSAYLAARLPTYMVPTWFSFCDTFPVTANGKLDREALPRVAELSRHTEGGTQPRDDIERDIQRLWCEVLSRANVPVDQAFHTVGGNSVLVVQLHSLLDARWPGCFSVPDLFALATVFAQAEHVREWQRASGMHDANCTHSDDETLEAVLIRVGEGELNADEALRLLDVPR